MMHNEHALPRNDGQLYYHPEKPERRRKLAGEKGRDPYDGLRPWSAITHGAGAALGVLGTVLLLLRAVQLGCGAWHLASFAIYGCSMIGLYTASTLYHCLNTPVKGRIALRKYDHASIDLLIAGTYTPICLVPLRTFGAWGWALFGAVWALALAGIALAILWIMAPRWLTAGLYLFMGWRAVFALYHLSRVLRALHRGRRALRRQVAGPGQPPLWLSRDLPRLYRPRQRVPLPAHVPGHRVSLGGAQKAVRTSRPHRLFYSPAPAPSAGSSRGGSSPTVATQRLMGVPRLWNFSS